MKFTKFLGALGLLMALSCTLAVAQPKMVIVGGETHDWGKVPPQVLHTEIQIKNEGNQDLHIKEVRPGCGCTASKLDTDVVAPGAQAVVKITLDAANKSGELVKIVSITTDDPTTPSVTYTLKASIKRAMTITPADYFLVNNGKIGVEQETKIMITNSGEEEFTVEAPEFVSGNMKVRFDLKKAQVLKPGDGMELKAFVTPSAAGSMNGSVKVKTTSKERPELALAIYGNIEDPTPPSTPATPVQTSVKENQVIATPTTVTPAATATDKAKKSSSKAKKGAKVGK